MTETVTSQDDSKTQTPSSPKTNKSKAVKQTGDGSDRPKTIEKVEKPPTKVVVRRLPPTMILETFLDQVAPLPPVDYMYFVKADSSLSPNSFGRAYLHFIHVSDLLIFTEKFDNYVFVDSKGNEYPAIVEYAPFQRIPKQRPSRKKDPRIGTIENDPYYLEFMEALKAEETQRKSASKSNKQHFFETSTTGLATPKVTSTPLLEYLKARRADKLRTKEDKIAERKKREIERRKAREDAVIKIAGHGSSSDKASKEISDRRLARETNVKEVMSKRREDDRLKTRDKERRDKDSRETAKDLKRDARKDSTRDQGSGQDKEKDKENQPASVESKLRDTRRGGKSYQEERQRLNERRAAKTQPSKGMVAADGIEKEEDAVNEDCTNEKKTGLKKELDASSSETRGRPHEKGKNSDQYRQQSSREIRKYEKPNKFTKDPDQRRNYDSKKITDDRNHDDVKDSRKHTSHLERSATSDLKSEESRSHFPKEETRKKSYNQEREQRRAAAADKKSQAKKDSALPNKSDNKLNVKGGLPETKESVRQNEKISHEKERRPSLDNASPSNSLQQSEQSRSKSLADMKSIQTSSSGTADGKKSESAGMKSDEKDKKDPRAERRIRNKDRPSIEIYRPGMGRFSRQRLEREKGLNKGSSTERDSPSPSPSPVPLSSKSTVICEKPDE
ncbi:regulator of nonsense transcripts 3B isoform X3 [Frankliniella occidentalis]|uniref:Regulator of nonsense transcripts 3B isoform X3 n=1 Tax=Frankliniella occidentalis TaxID=133901 RepID=A0A6J1S3K2_FRAOC|nr:regulator of nonsense transcripts 3B isoform X3 [Frankliniella occidentalis]